LSDISRQITRSFRSLPSGAYVPRVHELQKLLSTQGLRLWDVENIAPHYHRTLDRWSERFEGAWEQVVKRYGMEFARMWRLYPRGTSICFREGVLEVHQLLVSGGNPDPPLPLSRTHSRQ